MKTHRLSWFLGTVVSLPLILQLNIEVGLSSLRRNAFLLQRKQKVTETRLFPTKLYVSLTVNCRMVWVPPPPLPPTLFSFRLISH